MSRAAGVDTPGFVAIKMFGLFLAAREKGETLRRLFKTVTLFWDKHFHPSEKQPSRPRKTARKGRYSYSLRRDQIKWEYATSDLECSWSRTVQIGRLFLLLGTAVGCR